MERKDMQPLVTKILSSWVESTEIPGDLDHRRRLARVLIRQAARIVINAGASAQEFMMLCMECIQQEGKEEKYPTGDLFPSVPKDTKEVN
jgi:hypothetical protein